MSEHSLPPGYVFSADPERIDADRVHQWLATDAYWALGRPRDKHDRAMADSLVFGVYDEAAGEQVAFARIITDGATFAWLCDVYVDPQVRGKGLGTAMVAAVRDHLRPFGLRRIMLATADAHGVYASLGFTPLTNPDSFMVLGES